VAWHCEMAETGTACMLGWNGGPQAERCVCVCKRCVWVCVVCMVQVQVAVWAEGESGLQGNMHATIIQVASVQCPPQGHPATVEGKSEKQCIENGEIEEVG